MTPVLLALLLALTGTQPSGEQPGCAMSLGSHPGWSHDEYPPGESFDYTPFTDMMHFGALVRDDGTVSLGSLSSEDVESGVRSAHDNGKGIIAVIGSEGNGDEFASATGSSSSQGRLARSIVSHVNQYGYDGYSIDWEESVSRDQYLGLFRELHALSPDEWVTMADVVSGLVEPGTARGALPYVDYLNLMAYWSDGTDEIAAYHNSGIPYERMNLGVGLSPEYHDQTVANVRGKLGTVSSLGLCGVEVWAIQDPDLRNGFDDPRLEPLREYVRGSRG